MKVEGLDEPLEICLCYLDNARVEHLVLGCDARLLCRLLEGETEFAIVRGVRICLLFTDVAKIERTSHAHDKEAALLLVQASDNEWEFGGLLSSPRVVLDETLTGGVDKPECKAGERGGVAEQLEIRPLFHGCEAERLQRPDDGLIQNGRTLADHGTVERPCQGERLAQRLNAGVSGNR